MYRERFKRGNGKQQITYTSSPVRKSIAYESDVREHSPVEM